MAGGLVTGKILITGGFGFLGARLAEFLCRKGYDVSIGSRDHLKAGSVIGCKSVLTDWNDPNLEFCRGFHTIIHTAAMGARECENHPHMALEVNGILTEKIVNSAIRFGCSNFYYLSTIHVYAAPLVGSFSEYSSTTNTHPYATSHLVGEIALIKALENKVINGAVLRLSNCFGSPIFPNDENLSLVINQFARDAILKNVITINGNALTKRDFIPISEFTSVFEQLLRYKGSIPNIINMATGKSLTIKKTANLVADLVKLQTGKDVIIYEASTPSDTGELRINTPALDQIGLSLPGDLNNEIKNLMKYFYSKN